MIGLSRADQELLGKELTIEDPASVAGLVERLPDDSTPVRILFKYNLNGSGRSLLRCSHCHRPNHLKGYVVQLDNDATALIGSDCGRNAFGFDWDAVTKEFQAEIDRKIDVMRLVKVASILPRLIDQIETVIAEGEFAAFDLFLDQLRRGFGKLGQALARAARDSGRMVAVVEVRSRRLEEDHARRTVPHLVENLEHAATPEDRKSAKRILDSWIEREGQRFTSTESDFGRCAGWQIFEGGGASALTLAESTRQKLQSSNELISQTNASAADQSKALKYVQDACESATLAMSLCSHFERFIAADNLKAVTAWLTASPGVTTHPVRAIPGGLDWRGSRLTIPQNWQIPALPALTEMKDALMSSARASRPT